MEQLIQNTFEAVRDGLNTIHQKRKRAQFFQKIMWLIAALFFILMLVNMALNYFPNVHNPFADLLTSSNPYASIYPIVGLVVLLYPSSYLFARAFSKFKTKEIEIIKKMVNSLFPKVEFTQGAAVPQTEIEKSKLFAWIQPNTPMYNYGQMRNSSENGVVNIADIGIIENNVSKRFMDTLMRVPFLNLFAILYQYVFKNLLSNKSADNVYYTYRGMFCWLRFKKSLQGHTVILTNNQSSKLNRFFGQSFKEEEKIELEDPRFTDEFIVYSTDQIEARYVLSAALMERIVELKNKFNQPILLSFRNREMYLAVKNVNGIFSFPAGKLDDVKIIEELGHDIQTALDISTELNLK